MGHLAESGSSGLKVLQNCVRSDKLVLCNENRFHSLLPCLSLAVLEPSGKRDFFLRGTFSQLAEFSGGPSALELGRGDENLLMLPKAL